VLYVATGNDLSPSPLAGEGWGEGEIYEKWIVCQVGFDKLSPYGQSSSRSIYREHLSKHRQFKNP
jgi:hypothetical protein